MITKKASLTKTLKNIYFEKKTPVSLIHFLTNRCNARCSFCFIDFDNPNTFKGELTIQEIDKMTKKMGDTLINVNFTGGEPFARKDILEIAKLYITNTTVQSIYITTNGSLPDRVVNFAKEIEKFDNDIELNFQISIDDLPDRHNAVRRVKNIFENGIKTYKMLEEMKNPKISPNVSITVSHENCSYIEEIFYYLTEKCGVKSLKCCIVRDEGVYKTPIEKKEKIINAYSWLTDKIKDYQDKKKINNYNNSIQGKLHNKKDEISWKMVKKIYKTNEYISPCHASSLFGVITSDGNVYPCEILEDKKIGNLRDYDMHFLKLWESKNNKDIKNFIKDTKCRCTYECALSFNILGNYRYQHKLLLNVMSLY